MKAATNGDFETLQKLLVESAASAANGDLKPSAFKEERDGENFTPLLRASMNGHTDCVEALINAGANVEAQNVRGNTALIGAAFGGHDKIVELLLQAGADVNLPNKRNETPLLLACGQKGHISCVELLIKAGANPNVGNADGFTPLMMAVYHNHKDILVALIKAKADLTAKDRRLLPAIWVAWAVEKETRTSRVEIAALLWKAYKRKNIPFPDTPTIVRQTSYADEDYLHLTSSVDEDYKKRQRKIEMWKTRVKTLAAAIPEPLIRLPLKPTVTRQTP